ncbi:short transient receptor potential channel 7-like [Ruditapes philippinarum]|uniref:short transient receptor potential channel 7-like n=1 Tax=Ruditapes philippinarum TaxID=129788 RepID=UPI00295BB1ED|nr:short transient receptor potential channel 7-like [Ruditapes philippinarum]
MGFKKNSKRVRKNESDTNLMSVVSMIKLQNMSGGKAKFWRRRNGSSRMSLISNQSQESKTLVDVEEEFLHAAEFGDIPTVRRLLAENSELNVDCIDALGRTALRLAVKNEHLEVVEVLLEKSSSRHIYEAVLQAISAGHVQIAENILKHKRYLEIWKERKKFGDDDHFFKTQYEESQFSPDITPLILAAQKNQYEIVQLLLLRGDRIQKPHKFGCLCQECVNKMKFDQLRSAKYRLNAYRGMSSEAYISLSSKDPVLTSFQLSHELKNLSRNEKYFKQEYRELSNQLSAYVVKLLDRVRTQDELELVLNKAGKPNEEKYSSLARLRLALQYGEKKFVSHPSCQQRLDRSWYEGIGPFLKANIVKRILMVFAFILAYPFLNLIYIITPKTKIKVLKVLQFPWIKFTVHSASFVAFLLMSVISTSEDTYILRKNSTLSSDYPQLFEKYQEMKNRSPSSYSYGNDIPIRQMVPTTTQLLISIWVVGFLYHECTQIYHDGVKAYCLSLYNMVDFAMLITYTCAFGLKYLVMLKVHLSLDYFQSTNITDILNNDDRSTYMLYWIVADRYFWSKFDPINLSEGLFAIANIISFSRISYLLPANEALGPLQISLGRMLADIIKCLCLLSIVVVAFLIGLQNLYWYYNVRESIEVEKRNFEVKAQDAFGDTVKTFRTIFWSVFGRGESDVVTLADYNNSVTEDIGYCLYGLYNFLMVTVLLNMLIAMMARSFQAIAESSDVEWKFARSQLYMEYMTEEDVLPVPLNIVRLPRAIFEWIFDCWDKDEENLKIPVEMNGTTLNDMPVTRNGADQPLQSVTQIASQLMHRNDSASSSVDLSAVDIYEGNITANDPALIDRPKVNRRRHMQRNSIPGFLDGSKSYQRVMQRIIQRYIFDIQREAEVTEDDFEEIKQDLSSFRYEMLNVMRSREMQFGELHKSLSRISSSLNLDTGSTPSNGAYDKKVLSSVRDKLLAQKMRRADSFRNARTPSEGALDEDPTLDDEEDAGDSIDKSEDEIVQQNHLGSDKNGGVDNPAFE